MNKLRQDYLDFLEEYYLKTNDSVSKNQEESSHLVEPKEEILFLNDLSIKSKERELQIPSVNLKEKEAILEVDLNFKEIPFKVVCLVLAFMFVALLLFAPKIYIRNNIYYTSRNLIQLQAQLDSLSEENKHIKKQLEDIKFKNLTYELNF